MTLISYIQNVANEAGYTVAPTAVGSTDATTKQLLTIANRINREIAEQYPWPLLYASSSITLATGQASYSLPTAFSYYHYETFWNQSTRWRVLGPITEQEYAEIQGYGLNTTVYQKFQIRGISNTQLLISPTPTSANNGQVIIFEYMMDRCARPRTWATGVIYTANSYTFFNGNYYVTTAGGTTGATAPTHTSGTVSDGGVSWTYYDGPYNDFLADTDVTLFNPKTLELGIMERFAEIHGLTTIQPRFALQMNEDFSRQNPGKNLWAGGPEQTILFARSGVAIFGTWI